MKKNQGFLIFIMLFTFFVASSLDAQIIVNNDSTGLVEIKVVDGKQEPVIGANVTIAGKTDTAFQKKFTTGNSGKLQALLRLKNQYVVSISHVNYQPLSKGINITKDSARFVFELYPASKILPGVVVTSQRPLMRQEDDKTIIDPESLVESSTSGYEVIEKTPGIFMDQDGNIYISSLTPATVQINGRDMKMSAADMASLLKNLPPNSIQRIEILRTPSAKYDASTSGGIVNVVLKKGIRLGMTGSVTTGVQQGFYGNQFVGFNLNNNNGNKSSFINLNVSQRNSYDQIITDRMYAQDTQLSQNAFTKYPGTNYFASYALVTSIGKKWDLDFGTSIGLTSFKNDTKNESSIYKVSDSILLSNNYNTIHNKGYSLNFRSGLEAKKSLDTSGSEWVNDVFYNYSKNNSEQDFYNLFSVPISRFSGGDGTNTNDRHFFHLVSDLKLKLKSRLTLESGFKSTFSFFKSESEYYRGENGMREIDYRRTNTFHYYENINAFYLQAAKTIGKDFVIKGGTRLENTIMDGEQLFPGDTTFQIRRTDLFPYIYLSKNLLRIAGYDLRAYVIYRRSIARPGYEQLNPFLRYIDEYLSETGNPALRPKFTANYEANISVDEHPILAVGFNDTKDIFTNVIYQADSSQSQAYRTYDNLGDNKEWYVRGLGAIPPGKKYFFVLGGQYNHNAYDGLYENKPLSFRKGTWTFFTYHSLKLGRFSQVVVNGFLRFKGQQQFYELGSFGALNTSINRRFLKEKLVVTLSMNDIFATNKNDFTINQGSVNAKGLRKGDTRRFGVNIRFNFGIRKKEENTNLFNVQPPLE